MGDLARQFRRWSRRTSVQDLWVISIVAMIAISSVVLLIVKRYLQSSVRRNRETVRPVQEEIVGSLVRSGSEENIPRRKWICICESVATLEGGKLFIHSLRNLYKVCIVAIAQSDETQQDKEVFLQKYLELEKHRIVCCSTLDGKISVARQLPGLAFFISNDRDSVNQASQHVEALFVNEEELESVQSRLLVLNVT